MGQGKTYTGDLTRKQKEGQTYVVKGGDSLAKIAGEVYGNQRMLAQISRLNGGVQSLVPGMVLKLPAPTRNEDIFISDNWAASMGMATSADLRAFYAANPTASATAAMNAGTWSPSYGGAVGGGTGGSPFAPGTYVPPTSGDVNSFITPNTMTREQASGRSTNVYRPGTLPQTPGKSPMQLVNQMSGQTAQTAQVAAPGAQSARTGAGDRRQGISVGTGLPASRPKSLYQSLIPEPGRPGESWEINQRRANSNLFKNALDLNNTLTGQLPAGASVSGGKTAANGQKIPTDPRQYYPGITDDPNFTITQALLNTPPEKAALYAPAIQTAMNELRNAVNGLPNQLSKPKIDLLFITGILDANNPDDVSKADAMLTGFRYSGGPYVGPQGGDAFSGSPNETAVGGNTAGYWDPWTNIGAKPRTWIRYGGGGGGGGYGGGGYGGYRGGSQSYYGSSLGLMNWRKGL